jgi:hypothetical protein
VLSPNALGVLVPILEKIVGMHRTQIRKFIESHGFLIQEWDKVRTDWITLRAVKSDLPESLPEEGKPRTRLTSAG